MKDTGRDENWLNPKVRAGTSTIHARGWFAEQRIDKGEAIVIWRKCYTDREGALEKSGEGLGIMQWDDDVFSYEHPDDPDDYVINHSCEPNTWMRDAYTVTARRNIDLGEEITIDYAILIHDLTLTTKMGSGEEGNDGNASSSFSCRCGSTLCRGVISDGDWERSDLQERYRGHFIPLLNKRMK